MKTNQDQDQEKLAVGNETMSSSKIAMTEYTDNSPEAIEMREYVKKIDNRPEAIKMQEYQDKINGVKKKNPTNIPDNIKDGIEKLSGISLDDVTVHYNSSKPAELGAYACVEGSNVYIAPNCEDHLPHELWHIIQQKQKLVKATKKVNGKNVDDRKGMEEEAEEMAQKSKKIESSKEGKLEIQDMSSNSSAPIQLFSADVLFEKLVADALPNLSTASGERGENFVVFQGDSPSARTSKEEAFKGLLTQASQLPNVYDQAARVSSGIKANQYFIDSNTRLSTLAVYLIYEASNEHGLKATPLETFAAIAENELRDNFSYADWLKSKQVDINDEEVVGVPSIEDLENIKKYSAVIAEASSLLNGLINRRRQFFEDNPTLEQAKENHLETYQTHPQVGEFNPEDYEDAYATEAEQRAAFIDSLDVDEQDIWANQELIEKGCKLIQNGRFLDSITSSNLLDDMDVDDYLEILSELTGLEQVNPFSDS